ncbi:MAG TPA: tetratricopeptide repeat protein, partial [Thermoanaerobaculia bacterium]|nr:tetratricopeptide repeat protein [Thermoanaerobaculia bacterium]
LLKLPGSRFAGRTTGAPAALTDVAPTLLSLLGLPVPAPMHGASLLALNGRREDRRVYSETFYPRLHFGWSELTSLVGRRYHYIEGPDPELFDLERDAREKRNLLREQRRVYSELRRELAGYDRVLAPPSAVDEETRQAMAALGYVGRGTPASSSGAGGGGGGGGGGAGGAPLPDSKRHLDTLRDLKQGFAAMARHDYRVAAATFERTLGGNPRMADAWEFLGRAREKLDDLPGALDAYRHALRIDPASAPVAMAAASVDFDLGQLDEAQAHARMAAAGNPSFAHGLLAQIAMRRGRLDDAEREARAALDEKGRRIRPLITLAEVLHARRRYEAALDQVRQAERAYAERTSRDPELIQGLALIRGKILADLGDAAGAEAAFREEIQSFPDDLNAWPNLAVLLALTGRPQEARDTLQRMVGTHPSAAAYAEAVKTLRVLSDPGGAAALLRYALRRYPGDPALGKL